MYIKVGAQTTKKIKHDFFIIHIYGIHIYIYIYIFFITVIKLFHASLCRGAADGTFQR